MGGGGRTVTEEPGQRFVGEKKDIVGNAWFKREPVELGKGEGDELPGLGAGNNPGSWILDILEPVQSFAGSHKQDSITVIPAGGDKSVDESLSPSESDGRSREMFLRWKKADLVTDLICAWNESVESRMTPRLQGWGDGTAPTIQR